MERDWRTPRSLRSKSLLRKVWTPPSHGGSTGSNPVCASNKSPVKAGLFLPAAEMPWVQVGAGDRRGLLNAGVVIGAVDFRRRTLRSGGGEPIEIRVQSLRPRFRRDGLQTCTHLT